MDGSEPPANSPADEPPEGRRRPTKTEPLDIPDTAKEVKAWFWEEPGEDTKEEIRTWIREGHMPHLWRGHTHTRPPKDARIVYLARFELAEALRQARRYAPCCICTSSHPKFGKGIAAWFPDEGVIRLLGPRCFATLNPEGHERAIGAYEEAERRRRDLDFLAANVGVAEPALRAAIELQRLAKGLEGFRVQLRRSPLIVRLASQTRENELRVMRREKEVRGQAGDSELVEVDRLTRFGPLDGRRLIDVEPLGVALPEVIDKLTAVVEARDRVGSLTAPARKAILYKFTQALSALRAIRREIEEARQFVRPQTIATLRRWGADRGAPFPFYARLDGTGGLLIGEAVDDAVAVAMPLKATDGMLPDVPQITRKQT
jgi:hypothetical protein